MMQRFFLLVFLSVSISVLSTTRLTNDSIVNPVSIDLEATLDSLISKPKAIMEVAKEMQDSIKPEAIDTTSTTHLFKNYSDLDKLINNIPIIRLNTDINEGNFLLLPLILKKEIIDFNLDQNLLEYNLFNGQKPSKACNYNFKPIQQFDKYEYGFEIRKKAFKNILLTHPGLIMYQQDELPSYDEVKSEYIDFDYHNSVKLIEDQNNIPRPQRQLYVQKIKANPWTNKANAYIQFSENYISKNWHQGGSSNLAILGTLTAKFNYDNKKNLQWENSAEWRAGFHSAEGDTLRIFNTNDDILKLYSKLGLKAGGDFFYSGSFDFSTPFFKTFKGINSTSLKADFLTPVRVNIGVGMDYKYKKLFSVMVAPVSFKYIYLNNQKIDPKLFGIKTGEHILSEFGSNLKVQANYAPSKEMTFDTKFTFYTNYEKVEIDWELTGNFQINRFLSTRIMLNPRYDNTVILAKGESAKLQFKQLLTFGLSYRLLK